MTDIRFSGFTVLTLMQLVGNSKARQISPESVDERSGTGSLFDSGAFKQLWSQSEQQN